MHRKTCCPTPLSDWPVPTQPHVQCPIFSELFPDSHNTNNLPYFITFITHGYKSNYFISSLNPTMLLLHKIMNSLRTRLIGWIEERFIHKYLYQFSSVQSHSCVRLFATPRTAGHQASLSITNSLNLPKFMSTESSDATQPTHPLSSPSPPAFNFPQNQDLFK